MYRRDDAERISQINRKRPSALERRFQAVKVVPPNEAEALKIIEGLAERYEAFHQIRYSKEALEAAVYQSNRYIPDRFLPDKAIDVLDEAGCARQTALSTAKRGPSLRGRKRSTTGNARRPTKTNLLAFELKTLEDSFFAVEVTKDDVEEVIARWTGIPIQSIKQEEAQKLLNIETELHRRIISQRPAISALARAIRRSRAGLQKSEQTGRLVFVFRSDRRRQNRSRPKSGGISVRLGTRADSFRYVGVYGKTHGRQIYRLASGICRTRRRRAVDRKTCAARRIRSCFSMKSKKRIPIFSMFCCRFLKTEF